MRTLYQCFYVAIADPVFLYACSVWASFIRTKRGRKKIRSIERIYNVMMLRSFRSADAGSLSVLAGTVPADYRIREMVLRRCLLGCFQSFSPSAMNLVEEELRRLGLRFDESATGTTSPCYLSHPCSAHGTNCPKTGRCITAPSPFPLAHPDTNNQHSPPAYPDIYRAQLIERQSGTYWFHSQPILLLLSPDRND